MPQLESESTTTIRVAYVMFRLMSGERFTTEDVARMLNISRQGAWVMLDQISSVLPLAGPVGSSHTDMQRHWYMLEFEKEGTR